MSYKMLIAEDEQEEYELVLYLLGKLDMISSLQIYHAENGKHALQILEDTAVDLILTDIEMPFINGLEIAAKARADNPLLPIVFFSCYDDFTYMKTALSVRADNYLLKPLDPDEFGRTMHHVFELLQETERQRKSRENRIQLLKKHYLYLKLNRMPCEHLTDMEIPISNSYSLLLLLHFEEAFFDCEPDRQEELECLLRNLLPFSFDHLNLNPFQSVLLFKDGEAYPSRLAKCCSRIHDEIQRIYHTKCYLAISAPIPDENMLADAYEDACDLLDMRFFEQNSYVFKRQDTDGFSARDSEQCFEILAAVEADMDSGDMDRLMEDIQKLNERLEGDQNISHIYVRYLYSSLIQILYKYQDRSEMPGDIERIFSCSFISDIKQLVLSILAKQKEEQQGALSGKKHSIQLVKQYIGKHYGEPISLNDLAKAVYLNPSYLSTVFKLETGSSINRYIKTVRMEKAKQLMLQTNIRVGDVGYMVGFSNVSYFIRSFHEYFGRTPDQMRHAAPFMKEDHL